MFPIRDHHPSGVFPLATYALIGTNVAVFFLMTSLSETALETFIYRFALIPAVVVQGQNLVSFITSMFLHASIGHLLGNMLFLHIFGDNLEARLGHVKYLLYYLGCGLAASLLQIWVNPGETVPNLGASGAIAGIMGGYLLLFPREPIDTIIILGWYIRRITLPAYTMLFYWFLVQLLVGLGSLTLGEAGLGGVAYFAHIGGFIAGLVALVPFRGLLLRSPNYA